MFRFLVLVIVFVSAPVLAVDEVKKLNEVLDSLTNQVPIEVALTFSFKDTHDEDVKTGGVTIMLESDEAGFHTFYPKAVLDKMQQESAEKSKNEDNKSPTLDAANKLNAIKLHRMISDARGLKQFLSKAKFKQSRFVMEEGYPYQELSFDVPMEVIIWNKKTRQYVDDFESQYRLLLDENGYPAKSYLTYHGSGSAYLVFSMDAYGESTIEYQVVGDRLLQKSHKRLGGSSSMFGDFEWQSTKSIVITSQQAEKLVRVE